MYNNISQDNIQSWNSHQKYCSLFQPLQEIKTFQTEPDFNEGGLFKAQLPKALAVPGLSF